MEVTDRDKHSCLLRYGIELKHDCISSNGLFSAEINAKAENTNSELNRGLTVTEDLWVLLTADFLKTLLLFNYLALISMIRP